MRRRPEHRQQHRSGRVRAALSLGIVLALGVSGTFAYWTDEVTISGTTLTSGTLDLQVNSSNAPATTTLGMTGMVPGSSSAEVLTVKNNGNVPLKYTLTGGLTGTHATDYGTASALELTIRVGGTVTGSGLSTTCTGGSTTYGPTALSATVSTSLIVTPRGPLAATITEALCFQIKLVDAAPTGLQGKTATATFTATGTSNIS